MPETYYRTGRAAGRRLKKLRLIWCFRKPYTRNRKYLSFSGTESQQKGMMRMPGIIVVSGACGCGKTTFADAFARHLVRENRRTYYVIHGDLFHTGFKEPEDKGDFFADGQASDRVLWENILRFNWDCIIFTAERALRDGLDVIIDYVVEDELPRIRELAASCRAGLYYIVLTADTEEIERRIRGRGDTDMTERALFLKRKLEAMPENRGHIYNNTGKSTEDMIREIDPDQYRVKNTYAGSETGCLP